MACGVAGGPRHLGQLGGRHRHAEQADGQQVQHLGVAQAGHGPGRQEADDERCRSSWRSAGHPAPQHHRHEVAAHLGHVRPTAGPGPGGSRAAGTAPRAAAPAAAGRCRRPRPRRRRWPADSLAVVRPASTFARLCSTSAAMMAAFHSTGRDVGQEEAPVAVQHAQAPGRQHQDAGAGEQDAHQVDAGLALLAAVAGGEHVHQQRRRQHARQHQHRHDQRQHAGHRARHPPGLVLPLLLHQPHVDRDERRRQHPLAEQVLQQVRQLHRVGERVGRVPGAQVVRQRPAAHEPRDARRGRSRPPTIRAAAPPER